MKITKQGAKTIKILILLTVGTLIAAKTLPEEILIFVYPALLLALVFLLPVFHKYRKTTDFNFFGNLCFAAILTIAFLLLLPLLEVAGFAALSAISFVFVFLAMASEKVLGSDIDATLMTILFTVLMLIMNSGGIYSGVILTFLASAILLDLTRKGFPLWVRGALAGLVWAVVAYGFPTFYWVDFSLAAVFSTAAGLVVGSIFSIFHLDDEKHLDRLLKKW